MAELVRGPPPRSSGRSPRSSRGQRTVAVAAAVVAVAAVQVDAIASAELSVAANDLSHLLLLAALLGFVVFVARAEGASLRDVGFWVRRPVTQPLAFALLLVMLYVALSVDSGLAFGFGSTPVLSGGEFAYQLFSAPFVALAEGAFFFGYLLRVLARSAKLTVAAPVSASFFALFSTNLTNFSLLAPTTAVEYLFSSTISAFVLGLLLALYLYKSQWSLLGPVVLLSSILAIDALLPFGVTFPSWEVFFASTMVVDAVLLSVVGLGLKEPRLQAQRYLGEPVGPRRLRFRARFRPRSGSRSLVASAIAVGVVIISFGYGLPMVLGTPRPLLAVATGSMVPALDRGTLVVVDHVAPSSIHVGSIIAFSVGCLPSPTIHRVIQVVSSGTNWTYQTKGDANPVQDPCTVPYADVEGVVIGAAPYAGYLILDPLLTGAIVALLLVVPLAWSGRRP